MQGNLRQQGAGPPRLPVVNNRRQRVANIPRGQNLIPQALRRMDIPPAVNLRRNHQEQQWGRVPQENQGGRLGLGINRAGRAPGGAQQLPVLGNVRNLQNEQINHQRPGQGQYQIPRFAPNINMVPPRIRANAMGGYGPIQGPPLRQTYPYRVQP